MRNQHIKQLDRALLTGALSVSKDKGWTVCSKLALGGRRGAGRRRRKEKKKDYKSNQELRSRTRKLFTQTGNETTNLSFKKLYINSKCSGLTTIHTGQPKLLDFNYMKKNSSQPLVRGFCCLNHCVNSSRASTGKGCRHHILPLQ